MSNNPQDTQLKKSFNLCISNKSTYSRSSPDLLDYYIDENNAELYKKLLIMIEDELADPKAGPAKKYYALEFLKDASKRKSQSFFECLTSHSSLLNKVFKIALIDKEKADNQKGKRVFETADSKQKPEYEALGLNYIQVAIEVICFWGMQADANKTSSTDSLREYYFLLKESGVKIPGRLSNFGIEFIEPTQKETKAETIIFTGQSLQNLVEEIKLPVNKPAHQIKFEEVKKQNSNPQPLHEKTEQNGLNHQHQPNHINQRNDIGQPQVLEKKPETQQVQKPGQQGGSNGNKEIPIQETPEEEQKQLRLEEYHRLQLILREYQKIKGNRGKELSSTTSNRGDFVWKAKQILMDLNVPAMRLNAKSTKLREYPERTKDEDDLLIQIQNELLKYTEFENYIDRVSDHILFETILETAGKFFGNDYTVQLKVEELDGRNISPPSMKKQGTFALMPNFQRDESRNESGKFGVHTPAFKMVDSPSFKQGTPQSKEPSRFTYQLETVERKEDEEENGNTSGKNTARSLMSRHSQRKSLPNYNSEENQEKIKRLFQANKNVFSDLQNIKNGIVSSLQKNRKPVPWDALPDLEQLKQNALKPDKAQTSFNGKSDLTLGPQRYSMYANTRTNSDFTVSVQNRATIDFYSRPKEHENLDDSEIRDDQALEAEYHERPSFSKIAVSDINSHQHKFSTADEEQRATFDSRYKFGNPYPITKNSNPMNSDPESRMSKEPKYSTHSFGMAPSQKVRDSAPKDSKALLGAGLEMLRDLEENLSAVPNPRSFELFYSTACNKQGCVYEDKVLNITARYELLDNKTQGKRNLKVALVFRNKTNSLINNFKIELVKHPHLNFEKLPEKMNAELPAGTQTQGEFILSVQKLPFYDLHVKCQAVLQNKYTNEDINFKFIIPVTYNMFMTWQHDLTYEEFLEHWKLNQKVVTGDPKLLTNPLVRSPNDFNLILGDLLDYPGMEDEYGRPQVHALLGVFELDRKNVEYLIRINWIPGDRIVAFEIGCSAENTAEAEMILQALEFLFARIQEQN